MSIERKRNWSESSPWSCVDGRQQVLVELILLSNPSNSASSIAAPQFVHRMGCHLSIAESDIDALSLSVVRDPRLERSAHKSECCDKESSVLCGGPTELMVSRINRASLPNTLSDATHAGTAISPRGKRPSRASEAKTRSSNSTLTLCRLGQYFLELATLLYLRQMKICRQQCRSLAARSRYP